MIQLLQRLLAPAYLYALDPGPLGRWGAVYVVWATALLLEGIAAIGWYRRTHQTAAQVTIWACGVGLLSLSLRLLAPRLAQLSMVAQWAPETRFVLLEAWTARVWPISATAIAVLAPIVHALSLVQWPILIQRHIDALTGTLAQDDAALPTWQILILLCIHLAGLAWLWHTGKHPHWLAIPSLLALCLLPILARPRRLRPETWAPLLLAYLASLVCTFMSRRLDIDLEAYQGFLLPDPWSPWFNVPVVVSASVAYTLYIQVRLTVNQHTETTRARVMAAVLILALGLWLASLTVIHRTHGVTASDPYSYVQMTVDLAETGSPLHDFPLAGLARELELPTWPTVHIGYHPPFQENRSPTMWPIGWPLLMVPMYWLGGLEALYFAAPLMAACALLVTWQLANETLHDVRPSVRWTAAALTCALVATSPEGSERILVPMADAAAQLFTVLTLWLLLRAICPRRSHPVPYGMLAGASLGVAYLIRHPQLPLAAAAVVAVLVSHLSHRRKLGTLAAFGLSAFLIAIPDLLYHKTIFGGWLHTESTEWFLLSATNVGRSFFSILKQGLLRRGELGFILPFALYGAGLLWRRQRRPALVLFSGFLAVLLFHLCYAALRPRDLIAILPIPYLCAGYGFVETWRKAQQQRRLAPALLLTCCMILLLARSFDTLALPWREHVITFGHVRADQQQDFVTLQALTPQDAVICSMLNSGAIELHAGRQAIHPAPWTKAELHVWTDTLLSQGRPLYVLDDGEEMPEVLSRLKGRYTVQPIQQLDIPYFAIGGGNLPQYARLYQIEFIQ